MLVVISPAKKLDWSACDMQMTVPRMHDDAVRLVKTARNLPLHEIKSLMHLSDEVSEVLFRTEVFVQSP